jgi:hypothetical protein
MSAPMTVANIGSRASMSAKLARGSLAMASWSVTYGMTDEHTPTPAAASNSTGWPKARRAPPSPAGVTTTAAMSIEAASRSIPPSAVAGVGPALVAPDRALRDLALRGPVVRGLVVRGLVVRGLVVRGLVVRGVAIRCPRIT